VIPNCAHEWLAFLAIQLAFSNPALSCSSEQWFSFSEVSFQFSFGAVIRRARRGGSGLITGGNARRIRNQSIASCGGGMEHRCTLRWCVGVSTPFLGRPDPSRVPVAVDAVLERRTFPVTCCAWSDWVSDRVTGWVADPLHQRALHECQ